MRRILVAAVLALCSSSAFAIEPFSLPWVNHPTRGTNYSTSDHPGGIFVLEFLANFCSACNENAEHVDALATKYASEPRVQVLDMSIDRNDREIATWIRNHQPNHPVLKDVDRRVWSQVGEQYIPTVVILDCRGQEHFRFTGGPWDADTTARIHGVIDSLLATDCAP